MLSRYVVFELGVRHGPKFRSIGLIGWGVAVLSPKPPLDCGSYECRKQRMRFDGLALELRMELHCKVEWVRRQLNNLNQIAIRAQARESHSVRFELVSIHVIEFIAMAMPFGDLVRLVGDLSSRILR